MYRSEGRKILNIRTAVCVMTGTACTPTVVVLGSGKLTLEPRGDTPLLLQLPLLRGVTVRAQLTQLSGSLNSQTCSISSLAPMVQKEIL